MLEFLFLGLILILFCSEVYGKVQFSGFIWMGSEEPVHAGFLLVLIVLGLV